MCRWLAYSGGPVPVEELLFSPEHSIVSQSLTSYEGAETTNGDGFGIGWYAEGATRPSRYRSVEPAWNDVNLHDIVGELRSRMVLTHVRASSGAPVQLTNSHPFRHGNILFIHNGVIEGFQQLRRRLLLDLDESLFDCVSGSTDSEVLFYLAIGYGLAEDPRGALQRAVQHVEDAAAEAGIRPSIQMSVAVADGDQLCGVRYATHGEPRSLYRSTDIGTLRDMYPDLERFARLDDTAHVLVSEPLSALPGVWNRLPSDCFIRFVGGEEIIEPFEVRGRAHASARAGARPSS